MELKMSEIRRNEMDVLQLFLVSELEKDTLFKAIRQPFELGIDASDYKKEMSVRGFLDAEFLGSEREDNEVGNPRSSLRT
jgi:hypothetical protein